MPPKWKANAHSASGAAESQTTMDDGTPRGKRLRADQLFNDAGSESLASHEPEPGQDVNPVAPSYCSDEEEASQITPSPEPLTQVQPSFMVLQSGQQFGFKLPSQSSTAQYIGRSAQAGMISVPRDHAALARRMPSFKGYQSSLPSSRGSSVFSAALLCGGSTAPTSAPTSHAPSECRSNSDYGTRRDDANAYQLAPLRQSSQLQALAVTANQSSEAHFQNRLSLPSLNINTQVMNPLIHPHHNLLGCVEPSHSVTSHPLYPACTPYSLQMQMLIVMDYLQSMRHFRVMMIASQSRFFVIKAFSARIQMRTPFGFKLPSQSSTAQYIGRSAQAGMISVPQDHAALARRMPSFKGYQSSLPSSRGSSVFSAALLCGGSTAPTSAPTSHAPSECRSNSDYGTRRDDANAYQLAPLRQSSQLQALAVTANQSSEAHFQNRLSLPSLNINTQVMNPLIHPHHNLLGCVEPSHSVTSHPLYPACTPYSLQMQMLIVMDYLQSMRHFRVMMIASQSRFFVIKAFSARIQMRTPSPHVPGLTTTQRDVEDVVAQHRQRNRAPRLPSNVQLLTVHNQQNSQGFRSASHTNSAADDLDNLETPISTLVQSSAQQSSSATDVNLPSAAHPVATIVSNTSGTLPDNNDPLQLQFYVPSVRDIIERAKQFSHCNIASLWEDIGNWQSSLKEKARSYVRERYKWDPENRRTVNADIAKKLLDRGPNSMGNLFPKVFEKEVPRATIKLTLDEMAAEGKEVTFKRDVYSNVYVDIISLMTKCDTVPVHHAKTKALRVQWAKIGR
ncbi:hypothetical protein BS17DRAFT_813771 [Gyrodon lividus]|nr:hypothetical protein BS17DRAFT_813771 [Gyrodon lividus]